MSRDATQQNVQKEEARKDSYTGMIKTTMSKIPDDYSSQQKADITSAELGGIDVGYGNLRDEITRRQSATGSAAGVPEALMESSREGIAAKAAAGEQLQETFANVPVQRALQQASVFQPAVGGMLYNRYPSQPNGTAGSIIGTAGGIAATAAIAF